MNDSKEPVLSVRPERVEGASKEKKNYRYLVTMRWYVETYEELVPGARETDEKILDILRHRLNGTRSCSTCPTRHPEGYAILRHHDFMGNKPIHMSPEKITEK